MTNKSKPKLRSQILILFFLLQVSGAYAMDDLFPRQNSPVKVDWDKKGEVYSRVYFDTESDGPYEDNGAYDTWIKLENSIRFEQVPDLFLKIDGEARVIDSWGGASDAIEEFNVQEAYGQFDTQKYRFVIGRQTLTWGKMDDTVILDIVNAQDMRQFFLYDKNERKIPAFMLEGDFFADNWQLEAVYLPFANTDEIDYFESDFSVFGHVKRAVAQGNYAGAAKSLVSQIAIQDKDDVTDRSLKNGQAAIRFKSRARDVDYGLYFLSLLENTPTLRERSVKGNDVKRFLYTQTGSSLTALVSANPSGNDLELVAEHPRVNVIGADFETVVGAFGVRGEIGFFSGKPYLKDDFAYTERDLIATGLGVDHTTAGNLYMNFQYVQQSILSDESLFAQKRDTHALIGSLSKPFLRGKVTAHMDFAYNLSWKDWMINPEISYDLADGVNTALGLFVFGGDTSTLFGRYNDKDLVYFTVKYSF